MLFVCVKLSLLAAGDDAFFFLPVVWQKHVEDVQFFGFLFGVVGSSGLKTFFGYLSGNPLKESVVQNPRRRPN